MTPERPLDRPEIDASGEDGHLDVGAWLRELEAAYWRNVEDEIRRFTSGPPTIEFPDS